MILRKIGTILFASVDTEKRYSEGGSIMGAHAGQTPLQWHITKNNTFSLIFYDIFPLKSKIFSANRCMIKEKGKGVIFYDDSYRVYISFRAFWQGNYGI